MVADQLIYRLDYIHSKYIIHWDIEPDQRLDGCRQAWEQCLQYITDMGIATEYSSVEGDYPPPEKSYLMGTAPFACIKGPLGVGKWCGAGNVEWDDN